MDFTPQAVLIVMEATGCYWIAMATALVESGFRVSVVNPRQAHHFAKALLQRSKTDAICSNISQGGTVKLNQGGTNQ